MSEWVKKSIYACPQCGHLLDLKLVQGNGWIPCACGKCGADAPQDDELRARAVSTATNELHIQVLEGSEVGVIGEEGGWRLTFTDGGPAGACYSGEILMSLDDVPPFPEGFHGFISWAGEGLIVVDQDSINGSHNVYAVNATLPESALDSEFPWKEEAGLRSLAEHLYRLSYSRSAEPLN